MTVIKPIGNVVVVKRDELKEKTSGGILLPEAAQSKSMEGTVVELGFGEYESDNSRHKFKVSVGDRIVFSTGSAIMDYKIDGVEYAFVEENSIIGILHQSKNTVDS